MVDCDVPSCYVGVAVVEDEKDLARMYQLALKNRNVQICFIAYDGLEAVKKFTECPVKPPIILLDYRLPTMNGIDVMKEIHKLSPDTRMIILSADGFVKKEAIQAGAFMFLDKPCSFKVVIDAIDRARNGHNTPY